MRIRAERRAARELLEARMWYRQRSLSAERSFFEAYARAKRILRSSPEAGVAFLEGTRRLVMSGFPYSIVYRLDGDWVTIVAVAHASRRPGYWLDR